jgi:hypothetical protein
MATSGEKKWPRMGRNRWPLTAVAARQHTRRDLAARASQKGAEAGGLTAARLTTLSMMVKPCPVPGENRTASDPSQT